MLHALHDLLLLAAVERPRVRRSEVAADAPDDADLRGVMAAAVRAEERESRPFRNSKNLRLDQPVSIISNTNTADAQLNRCSVICLAMNKTDLITAADLAPDLFVHFGHANIVPAGEWETVRF